MTDTKLRELLVVIDDHYGRARSLEERRADTQIYIRAFGTIPDEIVEKALYTAFTQCRFQNQLIVDWCAEIKKLLSAQQPSANDLWAQAAAAARKIEANLYYQTHGGFIAPDGRKLKGEDFKKENAKIFAALPMVVQRWAGSPADLSEIFSSRSSADLRQFVRPGFDRAVQDAPVESLQPPALPGGFASGGSNTSSAAPITVAPVYHIYGMRDTDELRSVLNAQNDDLREAVLEIVSDNDTDNFRRGYA